MMRRAGMWMVAAGLVMVLAGCATKREPVTLVEPSYSYVTDGRQDAISWVAEPHDRSSVQAALADEALRRPRAVSP